MPVLPIPCSTDSAFVLVNIGKVMLSVSKRVYSRATVQGAELTRAEFRACDWSLIKSASCTTRLNQRGRTEHILIVRLSRFAFLSDRLRRVRAIEMQLEWPYTAWVQMNRLLSVACPRMKWLAAYERIRADRKLALAMGTHRRLGVDSVIRWLDVDLLCVIFKFVMG